MTNIFLKGLLLFGMAMICSLMMPGKAMAAGKCGGENQKSCWNVNPKKWCNPGLKYETKDVPGSGRCRARNYDSTPNCGGLNQKSCWNVNPAKWCDDGLQYQTKGLPGSGRCRHKIGQEQVKRVARQVYDRAQALGAHNPLTQLANCLHSGAHFGQLQKAMRSRSANGVNGVLAACDANPNALRSFGASTLGASNGGAQTKALTIELGGTAVVVAGVQGGIGYVIELEKDPISRFYLTGGLGGGPGGESASADLSLGLTSDSVPTGKWAKDQGKSVDYAAHALGGAGVSIGFPGGEALKPNGISISAGGGVGVEINTIFYNWDLYLF